MLKCRGRTAAGFEACPSVLIVCVGDDCACTLAIALAIHGLLLEEANASHPVPSVLCCGYDSAILLE